MGSTSNDYYPGGGWVTAGELSQAVDAGLLTHEEARTVYWAQHPSLQRQAATTAPPISQAA